MDELGSRPAEGQRVRTTLDGEDVQGTVASVTYTPKKGNLIAKVTLDEQGPAGREALAVAVEDLDRID
jgi:glycine cleavage system aminomethyltransferase T